MVYVEPGRDRADEDGDVSENAVTSPFALLREAFPPALVGKLPRVTCKACADTKPARVCGQHRKAKCAECGNYMTTEHVHLDFVGHAAVTDRLLQVDPIWTWEPMATDEDGLPILMTTGLLPDENVGLWINLTVADVTRPGFGGGKNTKEAIGDALRNAAMRFGVGIDLWSKQDLDGGGEHAHGAKDVHSQGVPSPTAPTVSSENAPEWPSDTGPDLSEPQVSTPGVPEEKSGLPPIEMGAANSVDGVVTPSKAELPLAEQPQVGMIYAIRRELVAAGLFTEEQFRERLLLRYGTRQVRELSKEQASELIEKLSAARESIVGRLLGALDRGVD